MKAYSNSINNPGANTIVRSILFWSLFIILLFTTAHLTPLFPGRWSRLMYGILGILCAMFTTWLFLKYEKKSFREIGWVWERGTVLRFLKGVLVGSLIFALMLAALLSFTELQLQPNTKAINPSAIIGYLAILPLALMEEMAFRSYPFLKLHHRFGLRTTQLIVAIFFALYHIVGGQSVLSSILGPGVWAFLFGLTAIWSGGIAMPFGIHVALNVLQPLTGMKGNSDSLWVLNYKNGVTADQMARTETIGWVLQIALLVVTIVLMEYFIRKRRNNGSEVVLGSLRQREKEVI